MELQKIRDLLEKYEAGETSLAEEKKLREYFAKNELPDSLKPYQLIFGFSEIEKKLVNAAFNSFCEFAEVYSKPNISLSCLAFRWCVVSK